MCPGNIVDEFLQEQASDECAAIGALADVAEVGDVAVEFFAVLAWQRQLPDVLAAGFPTVPLAAIPDALAVTAVTEALALALPAKEGASPPWLQTIAQVGLLYPRSPAMPWTVAYLCRPDDGGPAWRARAALCPYWNSAAVA